MQKFLSITKTWRDKENGNTYFSTRVYNEDLNIAFVLPMQYGYDNQSESAVYKKLDPELFPNSFKVEFIKVENQKKKDVEKWGDDYYKVYIPE